jgi:DNA replication protein DnaC
MTEQTLTRLRNLKLTDMADAVQQQQEQASTYEGLPFIERLSLLVEHEQLSREQRKQARLLKLQATVQELDYLSVRNLERSQVANLAQGEWLRRGQNLLITVPAPVAVALEKPTWLVRWATKPVSKGIALVTTGCHVCCSN